ncbi:MAG TPA: GH3 auxin-responsive promoter family protein [Bacteroidales bacterium]|nr:GH3 auxin-responsive promoter family protein [Bacteroidales bacterium]
MPILTSIINWLNVKRVYQMDLFRKYPGEVQQDTFQKLISRAEDTDWGRRYQYSSITTIRDFQSAVPVQTYEDVKPYIDRLRQGEYNLLWPGEIKWFAKSSGTTNDKSKFIPVSSESLKDCHFKGAKDVLAIYCQNNPETTLFKGKGLTLGGSHKIDNYNAQSYYGDLSAILIENQPFWTEFIRTPSQEVALLEKFEEKLEHIAGESIHENVTSIAGVPSWNLVMLKYMLKYTGKSNILEIWPGLELFMHGGVSFTPYREQFKKLIPSENMHYLEAYNASEGFFAIQDDPRSQDLLLMLDYGIFFEFIPVEELDKPNPAAFSISEVEKDKNYALIISTNSGLWRYMIGDTVRFTSVFPHKVVISGRTKHFINVFGEEVIVDNADKALKVACDKTGAAITDYTAAPVYMSDEHQGAHEWIIEFDNPPDDLDYFTTLLDHALMSINSDYEAKRYRNLTLDKPVIHAAKPGSFYRWLQEKGKLGGQNKVPRLFNERKYLEELLELQARIKEK